MSTGLDTAQLNKSIVSVVLRLQDYKNLYSRNHAFALRFNGETLTNTSGVAFHWNDNLYVISDANLIAPYSPQQIRLSVRLLGKDYAAQVVSVHHWSEWQSAILGMDSSFRFGYLKHSRFHCASQPKFAHLMLLKLTAVEAPHQLAASTLSFQELAGASTATSEACLGRSILSVSHPFGALCSNVLSHTVSHGILSTRLAHSVWLSDMQYVPGMEGGAVLCGHHWIGLLSIPLLIGDSAALSTIVPASAVVTWLSSQLQNLHSRPAQLQGLTPLPASNTMSKAALTQSQRAVHDATKSVVPLRIGSHWGSALMIGGEHLVTNAHILRPYLKQETKQEAQESQQTTVRRTYKPERKPLVGLSVGSTEEGTTTRKWVPCTVRYVAHSDSPWDVAWISISEKVNMESVHPIRLQSLSASKTDLDKAYRAAFESRERVFAAGYGLIHPSHGLSAVVSSGVLSKVVREGCETIMLRCSADVHSGHSGGLLCDAEGLCLGMLTNNAIFDFDTKQSAADTLEKERLWSHPSTAEDHDTKEKMSVVFPKLNSAIPFSRIFPLYRAILDGADESRMSSVLADLDAKNTCISAKWNLVSPEKLEQEMRYSARMEEIMRRIPNRAKM